MIRSLRAAVRFLTRVPVPGAVTTAADLPAAIAWFPVVGAAVGAAIGGVAVLALPWWGPAIAAVLAIAIGLLLTGGFHEDAASDAADGLGGGFTTERVLEIMRDSRIGAYGAMTLWVVLSLRALLLWRALDILPAWQVPLVYGLACAWGRWSAAPLLAWLPPLAEGLAKDVARQGGWWPLLCATGLVTAATGCIWYVGLDRVLIAGAAGVAACGVWGFYLWHRLRGQSGDLLGAGNQIVELTVLLVVLIRPD
jgi:adenosylcobinamide-GDP ribazoletransferase